MFVFFLIFTSSQSLTCPDMLHICYFHTMVLAHFSCSVQNNHHKTSNRSSVSNKCWVPDTGWGSRQLVLIKT